MLLLDCFAVVSRMEIECVPISSAAGVQGAAAGLQPPQHDEQHHHGMYAGHQPFPLPGHPGHPSDAHHAQRRRLARPRQPRWPRYGLDLGDVGGATLCSLACAYLQQNPWKGFLKVRYEVKFKAESRGCFRIKVDKGLSGSKPVCKPRDCEQRPFSNRPAFLHVLTWSGFPAVSRQALDSLPAELSSACVAALLRPAAQAALSRANDGASAAGDPSKPGTGCPSPNEIPGEGLPADGRSEPSRGNAKEDGQGSSRAAGARGAAFKLTVNLAADAAPSGANLDRHDVAAREHCLETEKADVPLVAESQAGPLAAGCSVEREGPAALSDGSGHGMTELPVEAGRESAKPNTCESSNTGAAEAARDQHSKAER